MTLYYLDCSAWVKRYYRETGTAWIEYLFAQRQPVACASLGVIEVTAALARKQKARFITSSQFEQKVRDLDKDWKHLIQLGLTDEVVTTARELAKNLALRGADAVHLASALLLKGQLAEDDQLILVTSDRELREAAQTSDLLVIDPEQEIE